MPSNKLKESKNVIISSFLNILKRTKIMKKLINQRHITTIIRQNLIIILIFGFLTNLSFIIGQQQLGEGAAIIHSNWPQSRQQKQNNLLKQSKIQSSSSSLGKNHLQGIRRLTIKKDEENLNNLEHRHLRHIASQTIQQNKNNNKLNKNGNSKMIGLPQKARIPPKIASDLEGREIMAMSSAEAEELALKLLQEAGIEHSSSSTSSSSSSEEEESEEQTTTTTTIKPLKQTKRKNEIQTRNNNNNSFVGGSSSLLPIRKFRLIQHQRKLLRESLNRTKTTTSSTSTTSTTTPTTSTTTPTTTTTISTTTTTQSTPKIILTTTSRPQRRNGFNVPKARKLIGGHNRIEPSRSSNSAAIDENENKNKEDQQLALSRRKLLESQLLQKQQQRQRLLQQNEANNINKQPKPWQPTLRMLRQRHRQRLLEEQKLNNLILQNNKLKEENNGRNRQFGIRTEPRRQKQNELINKDNLGKELLQLEGVDEIKDNGRQAIQLERRFRLVPNKVVFRPRLKIRRPQNTETFVGDEHHRPIIQLPENKANAFGTEQQRGKQKPIALPSLSAFGEEPSSEQLIPIPPSPGEPPPLQVLTQITIETTTTNQPITELLTTIITTTESPPAPAMEIGSMGEQPPMKMESGPPTIATTLETTTQILQKIEENNGFESNGGGGSSGLVGSPDGPGPLPPGFSEAGSGFIGLSNGAEDNGLSFGSGPEVGTLPPGFKESFGLNGFVTELETTKETTTSSTEATTTTTTSLTTTTELQTTTTEPTTTTTQTTTVEQTTTTPPSPAPPPPPEEAFVIPENSGLRPVAPPKEFFGAGGFGSSSSSRGGGFDSSGVIGGSNGNSRGGLELPPPGAQVEAPLKPEDFYTGDSALIPNKRGPDSDGYGPSVSLPGSAPSPPPSPPIGISGSSSGAIPLLPPFRPLPAISPIAGMGVVAPPQETVPENEATTVKPSALLNIINKADEGFNQVITHFEQGTPLEAAAIDIMEVALGSQKLDSQAKLLNHVDRAFGLDNLQRLQRWANTGGALDLIKEQLSKIVKNYKPPQETTNLFTVPPQLEYLFQSPSSGRRK